MSWLRLALLVSFAAPGLSACGGDCTKKAERSLKCPDGYVGYGRRLPNRNKGWLPDFMLADLSLWAADGTYKDAGRCEQACVPIALGEPEELAVCDQFQACGGDLLGDWRWDPVGCAYEVAVDMPGVCQEAAQALAVTNDGTVTFEEDGSVRFNSAETYHHDVAALPVDCTETLAACDDLFGSGDECLGDPAEGCTCNGDSQTAGQNWTGTWVKEGSTLLLTISDIEHTIDYCVDGETLILSWEEDASGVRVRERLFKFVN